MGTCRVCSATIDDAASVCPVCGNPAHPTPSPAAGRSRPTQPRSLSAAGHDSGSGDVLVSGRFIPGTLLAGRYRVVARLGRGGMGEVYRADDLKLGQAVALKMLPPGFEADEGRMARLLDEVRIARKVSHPNVCRVYDVGDVDGQPFITMEYIDGEDLSTLLRRIGRLPEDKALQIGRELCAGLAAAHDRGVIHRDLKPANVMIDGNGRAGITDFGLASLAGDMPEEDHLSGTPAYMAPEQLTGSEATVKSDIYALGLILYEIVTGRRAFEGHGLQEMMRLHRESRPATPSSLTPGIDPALERAILRCLETEPEKRPASALAVAASLPGGDPLAAALAAGETPSPQMVAAAGHTEGLEPARARALLAATLASMAVLAILAPRVQLSLRRTFNKPPAFSMRPVWIRTGSRRSRCAGPRWCSPTARRPGKAPARAGRTCRCGWRWRRSAAGRSSSASSGRGPGRRGWRRARKKPSRRWAAPSTCGCSWSCWPPAVTPLSGIPGGAGAT